MRFTVIGNGFVGNAVRSALSTKYETFVIDPASVEGSDDDYKYDVNGIILCLPAPTLEDGTVDHSILKSYMDKIPVTVPVLIKSTISPDFAR
jgi:hypothetical protein